MKSSRKLLTTALAATMLVGALSVSTPASAWHRWGWGPGVGYWGYGGWRRPAWGYGRWGYGGLGVGAGLATGLALGAAASAPYGYGYYGAAVPAYGYGGCTCW